MSYIRRDMVLAYPHDTATREYLERLPIADIVNCKDCVHYDKNYCYLFHTIISEYDYCSKGRWNKERSE